MALSSEVDYFSINDVLATQEKLQCVFEKDIKGLGFLDPSGDSNDIAKGLKIELPYWMLKSLNRQGQNIASVYEYPKGYKEGYREILSADASVVDLHKFGPYFYHFGLHLIKLEHSETPMIAKSLLQTFMDRVRNVMDLSQNSINEDNSKFMSKLDNTEKILFDVGHQGLIDFQRWKSRESEKITTSEVIINHNKRKRVALDS